ncbi:hypothetical protein Cgig2_014101 [Carnegiea gigantea]|uniref:Uncharacterized protein n=1 Tax=Carnegiea gigantea TaxID=171969 RepID=A0A9Q1KYP8_9CARY|nr:hypothetical protein Cgig2_014101 [Carnegiea gigantea]
MMGWGNIYKRRIKVFALALVIYLDYKALQQRDKWIKSKPKKAALWKKAHERNARRVLNFMIEMEGLWVKLGQYLSTRADVLPEAYIRLLKQLQDSLPPRPLEEVCRTVEKELGKSMEDLFSKFVEEPLATASIAQVHRATLRNGEDVVVKVQHEGIKQVILEDLKNAKSIVEWIAWAEPVYNFNPMIDEWCREAPKELDFNIEADNTRKVASNLGCNKINNDNTGTKLVDVLIPEVIQSTEKVIILEYMDGVRLTDFDALQALGVDRQKLVEEITRAYAHQIYVDGFFNGDPHPVWFGKLGNFLVSKEFPHRPVLLDFGLTKSLPIATKQALAKMLLASAEGDHVALLSAFAEMGLKLRMDLPEQAMEVTTIFFRSSTIASEAPVDAFPGDIVIFSRVLNLLRGLSATMNVRVVYFDIMRPFAESVLNGVINKGPALNTQWICDTPVHSDVEAKLRKLLIDLGNAGKILGIQVCAYKDGEVIIDSAAGVLGKYDPRPVQPDSLFPVFSVTKGIAAGMLHWLVDNRKLTYEENVANIWPEFASNKKEIIKVHHVLNHTSGLHSALANIMKENPLSVCDWNECLQKVAMSAPETEPGQQQLYHYLSFGWLCGGIIEHASGQKFQEVLEEAFIHPLNIEGELYVGIPPGMSCDLCMFLVPGVESRLAALTLDTDDLKKLSGLSARSDLPSTFQPSEIAQVATSLPALFNSLFIRRAIIPAANGHCSARALARYYACLADCGTVPKRPSSSSPPLGSHTHIPKFPSTQPPKKESNGRRKKRLNLVSLCRTMMSENFDHERRSKESNGPNYRTVSGDEGSSSSSDIDHGQANSQNHQEEIKKLFKNPRIHDAFMGVGEYEHLALPKGDFGLGFKRVFSSDGSIFGFGHSGMGGSTGFCDPANRFSIAVTVNKMSWGGVTGEVVKLVCSELNIPVPRELRELDRGASSELNSARPLIN